MNKEMFLSTLKKGLGGLPPDDVDNRLNFYSEMIDDLVEEGLGEEEAVGRIGSVGDIVAQILTEDTAQTKKPKEPKKCGILEITLLVLGSPIWVSLLIAAFAVIFSLYASLWSVIVSFWAVFVSLVGCAAGGILMSLPACFDGNTVTCLSMLGMGLFSAGLSLFCFHGCMAATKGAVWLTKKSFFAILCVFQKKEGKQ